MKDNEANISRRYKMYIICDTGEYDNDIEFASTLEEAETLFEKRIDSINPKWEGKVIIAEVIKEFKFPIK